MELLPKERKPPSLAGRIRVELSANARSTRPILRRLVKLPLSESGDQKVTKAMQQLDQIYEENTTRPVLPVDVDATLAPRWGDLIESEDRQQALRAYESAVLQELRQNLRSGAVWADNSIENRGGEDMFISEAEWKRSKDRYYRKLAVPKNPDAHLKSMYKALDAGLQALDEAVNAKAVTIDGRRISVPKGVEEAVAEDLETDRRRIIEAVGAIQLPELLVEMDSYVRFSWILLGRPPRSEQELLTVYGALLALGTELDAEGVASMISGLKAETIRRMVAQIQDSDTLRRAVAAVVEFLREHAIVKIWGDGSMLSSDAMSLEATRYLWKARVDPKHRRYAVGIYTHLLNQWAIVYDEPIVLGERQVGPAIDGALHQVSDAEPSAVAIDTHGYTLRGMAVAKFVGLDLCPQLRDLRNRLLYVPRGIEVPKNLISVVSHDVSISAVHAGWDPLARIAASIKTNRTTATAALRRLGASSSIDLANRAGTNLGKLDRTLFLLDYYTVPVFRGEMRRTLNYGESVHQLQRAIRTGNIPGKQGRRPEDLQAISNALTLLTNLVMAWTTHRLQAVADGPCKTIATPEVLRGIGPDQFSGINLRGQMRFPIAAYRGILLDERIDAKRNIS